MDTLSSRNFSQKTNERICFSVLTTRNYLKLEFRVVRIEKQIRSFIFWEKLADHKLLWGREWLPKTGWAIRKLSSLVGQQNDYQE